MNTIIHDIAYYLPENIVTNSDLKKLHPEWNIDKVEIKSGIKQRHISLSDETAIDLAVKACNILFSKNPDMSKEIDGLLFCTQTPDYIIPGNSSIIHHKLNLEENIFALDINLACSGFIHTLQLADSLIKSHQCKNILLITADTYTKLIHPLDRSSIMLFSDGATACLIKENDGNLPGNIHATECMLAGKSFSQFFIPAGGMRIPLSRETSIETEDQSGNIRAKKNIHMEGGQILVFVGSKVTKHLKNFMIKNNITVNDIDMFIFHQASKMNIDTLAKVLKIPEDKIFRNYETR